MGHCSSLSRSSCVRMQQVGPVLASLLCAFWVVFPERRVNDV
jgi:hypothetical protein